MEEDVTEAGGGDDAVVMGDGVGSEEAVVMAIVRMMVVGGR